MISTLKYIFQGRRDLFTGLKIDATDYDWKLYPVIHLNMAEIKRDSVSKIEALLMLQLDQIATKIGVALPKIDDSGFLFEMLLSGAAAQSPQQVK